MNPKLREFVLIKDYATGFLIFKDGNGWGVTNDFLKAQKWSNTKEATEYVMKYPMENWVIVFAKIKLTRPQNFHKSYYACCNKTEP